MFQRQRRENTRQHTHHQADRKHNQKYSNTLEQAAHGRLLVVLELVGSFKHDNRHCIVEDTLAKDYSVELWVYSIGLEDGENSDRVGGRERGTNTERLDK